MRTGVYARRDRTADARNESANVCATADLPVDVAAHYHRTCTNSCPRV